jgi:very-short-patch-repair endonuclease
LRLKGFKFRRQHSIGNYVVDFCCAERRLVIELDGGIHSQPSQALKDQTREKYLKRQGYTVARFPNGMVLQAPETFVEKVLGQVLSLPNVFTGER